MGRVGRYDLIAGLTAAAVVLPKAMAYATVAGLPVQVGLYTAFVPGVIYGLLGTSRVLSVSSTTTLAILTGTQLGSVVPDGDPVRLAVATATLTVLVGAALLIARVLRLGFLANFISSPVLTGFKAGIGLVILLDQAPKLFGIHIEKHSFLADALSIVRELPHLSMPTIVVGGATIAALVLLEKMRPHSPAPLVIVAIVIAATWLLNLQDHGVAVVGHIPRDLPSLVIPDPDLIQALIPGALGLALMSFTETIAAGRAFAGAGEPPIKPGRELVATGLANVAGGLFGAMPAGGGTSQTGVVRAAGGRTQVAGLVTAAAALATMLLLAPVLGLLPSAALAAIVMVYSAPLIRPDEFAAILRVRRMEFYWAVAAALGVLVFGTLQGIVVAIVMSLVGLAAQTAQPRISLLRRLPGSDTLRPQGPGSEGDEAIEGLLLVRPEGRLFFINAQNVADRVQDLLGQHKPKVLVLDLSRVPDVEYSALLGLADGERLARDMGAEFWLAGLNPGVEEVVRRAGLAEKLGPDRLFIDARAAVAQYERTRLLVRAEPDASRAGMEITPSTERRE